MSVSNSTFLLHNYSIDNYDKNTVDSSFSTHLSLSLHLGHRDSKYPTRPYTLKSRCIVHSLHKVLLMAPPSQLSIATSSTLRLVKEESSYHKELKQQESRLQTLRLEGGDENFEFTIKQQVDHGI